jgi:hypothetical protein
LSYRFPMRILAIILCLCAVTSTAFISIDYLRHQREITKAQKDGGSARELYSEWVLGNEINDQNLHSAIRLDQGSIVNDGLEEQIATLEGKSTSRADHAERSDREKLTMDKDELRMWDSRVALFGAPHENEAEERVNAAAASLIAWQAGKRHLQTLAGAAFILWISFGFAVALSGRRTRPSDPVDAAPQLPQ